MYKKIKKAKNILLGGGGFIGTNIQEQFPDISFFVYDIKFKKQFKQNRYFNIDLKELDFISLILEKLELLPKDEPKENIINIFVLAANLGVKNVIEDESYLRKEIKLQENLANLCEIFGSQYSEKEINIIYFSTSEIYGDVQLMKEDAYNKINLKEEFYKRRRYATTKLLFEDRYYEIFDKYRNINLLVIRPFNVVGKYQDENFVIPKMIIDGKLHQKIEVYQGSQERSFIHVYDFNQYVFQLLENIKEINLKYKTFNIANLKNHVKISFLAQIIQKILYDKYNFNCEIDIKEGNDLIVGAQTRIPDLSRLFEVVNYKPEKDLKDIINELVEFY